LQVSTAIEHVLEGERRDKQRKRNHCRNPRLDERRKSRVGHFRYLISASRALIRLANIVQAFTLMSVNWITREINF
jgi:hypothetical protein